MDQQESADATIELLDSNKTAGDLVVWLGSLAASMLMKDGVVTLFVQDERENPALPPDQRKRFIRWAPPTLVDIDSRALTESQDSRYRIKRFVRPIRTTGRPQFVARKDGELWEVELEPIEGGES